jgi:hypothetical protein
MLHANYFLLKRVLSGDTHDSQGHQIQRGGDGGAGDLAMAIPDRSELKTGKTETRIELMAIRRVKLRIDRELKRKATRAA